MQTFKTEQEARDYSKNNPSETVELKLYWSNGQLHMHCFFVNGKNHCEYKSYYENGRLMHHCFYVGGLRHGEFKWYHDIGKLRSHCFFVCGILHGEYKSHYSCGKLCGHYFYAGGKKTKLDHLTDRSYKSLCIKNTLFDGNVIDSCIYN